VGTRRTAPIGPRPVRGVSDARLSADPGRTRVDTFVLPPPGCRPASRADSYKGTAFDCAPWPGGRRPAGWSGAGREAWPRTSKFGLCVFTRPRTVGFRTSGSPARIGQAISRTAPKPPGGTRSSRHHQTVEPVITPGRRIFPFDSLNVGLPEADTPWPRKPAPARAVYLQAADARSRGLSDQGTRPGPPDGRPPGRPAARTCTSRCRHLLELRLLIAGGFPIFTESTNRKIRTFRTGFEAVGPSPQRPPTGSWLMASRRAARPCDMSPESQGPVVCRLRLVERLVRLSG